jgi:hypothetical protein
MRVRSPGTLERLLTPVKSSQKAHNPSGDHSRPHKGSYSIALCHEVCSHWEASMASADRGEIHHGDLEDDDLLRRKDSALYSHTRNA